MWGHCPAPSDPRPRCPPAPQPLPSVSLQPPLARLRHPSQPGGSPGAVPGRPGGDSALGTGWHRPPGTGEFRHTGHGVSAPGDSPSRGKSRGLPSRRSARCGARQRPGPVAAPRRGWGHRAGLQLSPCEAAAFSCP